MLPLPAAITSQLGIMSWVQAKTCRQFPNCSISLTFVFTFPLFSYWWRPFLSTIISENRVRQIKFSSLLTFFFPLFPSSSSLDKASIIRLTISYLKLREFSSNGHPDWSLNVTGGSHKSATKLCKQSKSTFCLVQLLLSTLSQSNGELSPFSLSGILSHEMYRSRYIFILTSSSSPSSSWKDILNENGCHYLEDDE